MIERRAFDELPSEDLGWLKARCHFSSHDDPLKRTWGCLCVWTDDEIAPNSGFALRAHADLEIITYVREGTITHRDDLGNEGKIEAGNIQVVSAGTGIRHAEYNLEQIPARIFQIWIAPISRGGSPAWGAQPCSAAECAGHFVALASGFDGDHDAVPIRARARVLKVKLRSGESINYPLPEQRRAYLVPSSGTVDVNGVRIYSRDGAAIEDVSSICITAIEDADVVMVDVRSDANSGD
jgi:redox-sensitive bicupin YhaK (pirin superfamily)